MHLKYLLAAGVAGASLACSIATPVMAQETTSAIAGEVTGVGGAPLAGAKVTVTHVPTGTVSTAVTDAGGQYSLRGLRVGGPYSVTVEGPGVAPQTIENIQLSVGDTLALPVSFDTNEIVVTGTRERSRELVTGSRTAFNAEDIANTVSSRRDVRDLMRKDLLSTFNANVGGVSIAGGNIRTQRFSVDGVQVQDSFGLNYGGLPSARGIVSLEAIDQLTVTAAPFDISEGNFQGGAVNVVLKSGTNDYQGSAFGNFGGPKLTGDRTRDNFGPTGTVYPVSRSQILQFRNYGGSISGPIVKDKLFVFFAYERLTEGTPNLYGVQGSEATNQVTNAFRADQGTFRGIDSTLAAFSANYGNFPVGDIPTAISERDEKYSAKVDWNITDRQRFTASYIHHENILPQFGSGGSTSTTTPYIATQSDLFRLTEFTNAGSAQLNSQWTDKFSTELRASYKYYRRGQDAFNGADFAQFNVCLDNNSDAVFGTGTSVASSESLCSTRGPNNTGIPILRLGPDTARQANAFNNKMLTFQARATYQAGAHSIKLEYDNVYSKLYNLFVYGTGGLSGTGGPQGLYYFDSFNDFANKRADELVLNSTTTGNKNDGFVRWGYTTHTVGIQDTWRVNSALTLNAGVRYDFIRADETIGRNQNFINRFNPIYPGLVNTATLNGRDKVQPRVGFNWKPTPTLRIAGGGGLFEGGLSDVFISNNYSNSGAPLNATGAIITGIDLVRNNSASGCFDRTNPATVLTPAICSALSNVNGATPNAAALAYLQTATGPLANVTTNSLDPRFKLPAQWKSNLSINWTPEFSQGAFGRGWTFRGDILFSDAQSAIRWTDLRAQPLFANGVRQVAPDGRPRYGANLVGLISPTNPNGIPGSNSDIQLTNTGKGISRVFAVGVNKSFDFVDLSAGYTHQTVKDVAGILVSSSVNSSYSTVTSDPNSGGDYGRSVFEVKHSYRLEADFHYNFFKNVDNAETRFSVSFNHRSGVPYSAVMFDNTTAANGRATVFGTVNTTSHLLFVPDFGATPVTTASAVQGTLGNLTQYGNVIFADAATLTQLQTLVQGTQLRKYQGRIAPKNLLTGPSYDYLNLNFAQDIPFFFHSKITALFSIENFLNLLNRDWGSYQEFGNTSVVRVTCQTPAPGSAQTCPAYIYSVYSDPKTTAYPKASLWTIRVGARMSF